MRPETRLHSNLIVRRGKAEDAELLAELGARTFSETFAPDNTPEDIAAYLASAFSPAQQAEELADPDCLFQIARSEEHTSELQSPCNLVCRLLLEKKKA